ncbi:MAG: Hint domain-containing protein [Pseudomonadota bacterium]
MTWGHWYYWKKKMLAKAHFYKHHCKIPCFTRGVMIDTPNGPVAVEDLVEGDLVMTADNGAQPVRWIGSMKIDAQMLSEQPELAPIRIKAGALGGGLPTRDLLVSAEHAVLLTDWRAELVADESTVLAPAKLLVNDSDIRPADVEEVEYFHLVFDQHQIVFAEGAAVETYRPTGKNYEAFDEARQAELLKLFPMLETDGLAYGPAARPVLSDQDWVAMSALSS